jgi:hypothetical protein
MKNLKNRLWLVASVGTMVASSFSLGACSDDPATGGTGGTGNTGTAGKGGGTSTAGGGNTSTGGGGASTGGGGASTGGGGASTGGGGASTGGGGAATGGGGAGGTTGGTAGGGAGGGGTGGGGGSAGTGGAAPSAACSKYCGGSADGVRQVCAGKITGAATAKLDTEAHCLESCAKPASEGAMGISCWNAHTQNAKPSEGDKTMHCPHATGIALCDPLP